MKITASKRDDIIKRRDEFDRLAQERKAAEDAEYRRYKDAKREVFQAIEAEIRAQLPKTNLNLQIDARDRIFTELLEVRVSNGNDPHVETRALTWDWTVWIEKDGSVAKESNSWSGLKAVTEEQLADLEDSIRVLRALNTLDWGTLLDKALPDWEQYVTNRGPSPRRPDFEGELLDEDIRETMNNQLIKGVAGEASGFRTGCEVYYLVHSETPKFFVVSEIAQYELDRAAEEGRGSVEDALASAKKRYTYRITKDKFYHLIGKKVDILTEDSLTR